MTFRLHRRGFSLLAASTVGLALAGGIAYATIPDSGGVIHTCFKGSDATKSGGAPLSIVDSESGATCKPGDTGLTFNQQGPPGPQGPAGPPGPSGALANLFQSSRFASVDNYAGQDIVLQMGSLPAGSYALDLTVAVGGGAGPSSLPARDLFCVFGTNQTNLTVEQMTFPSLLVNGNGFAVMPLLARVTLTESTALVVRCSIIPSNDAPHIVLQADLNATEVGSITFLP
jgi:hypothetical protein